MYSKEEAARLRQQFWITFGKYMKPIAGAEGMPVNWVNYKTGIKHIFFRTDADQKKVSISIEITHPDAGVRALFYEQLLMFKNMLHDTLGEEWEWLPDTVNTQYIPIAKIFAERAGLSIYNQQQWPEMISFLKPRIIALDEFWINVKPVFEDLSA
ncbi:DUF4268 domain-containing protein [Pedobacter montanisoli]|uniref:DUF4268 domain-containing protein n=1 Tax=Pedobacter montanisoli TaxID=2923277 RepID=A0ABS9ZV78_9SPHI|nr:DUF4268 domain-containing protein [Pedobacter montanisoli]MCJ0741089.1 DUF4268 domain-containing protein [Pedobacter montanisoli]